MSSDPIVMPLWEGTPPNHKESDLKEAHFGGDILRIEKVQTPTIEVRLPAKANSVGKAVVVCPGGGYGILAYDWEGTDIAAWLNSHGIAAVILKYRLPEDASNEVPWETPLMDAKRAMRLARAHAEEWNFQADAVGVMGFSAGGHLASTLGTQFDAGDASSSDPIERISSRPDFMILMYPVISMTSGVTHGGSKKNLIGENPSEELEKRFSGELQVTPNTPPTFIVHSSDDGAVPVENSLLFYKALLANKVTSEMHLYPYGGHGYSLAINKGRLGDWPELCVRWINELE